MPAGFDGLGAGLIGDYYSDAELANLVATRTDASLDFDWPDAPLAGAPADNFSARWTGMIQAQFTEDYVFTVGSAGATRLWIDGNLVIDDWAGSQGPGERTSSPVSMSAGQTYSIRLEFADVGGPSAVSLMWNSPSTPTAVVPTSQLYGRDGWLDAELGGADQGGVSSVGPVLTVFGGGGGTPTADRGHFLYRPIDGDGTVTARVTATPDGSAGVMLRDTLDPGAVGVRLFVDASGGVVFQARTTSGGVTQQTTLPDGPTSVWLKIERDGDLVSGYASASGTPDSWSLVGTATIPLDRTALGGLGAEASGTATTNAATFDEVRVTPTAPLGANLGAINYWSIANAFVDLVKQATFRSPFTGLPSVVDADGWPTEDFVAFLQSDGRDLYPIYNGTYHVSFTGRADMYLFATEGVLRDVVYDPETNRTTATVTLSVSGNDPGWIFAIDFRNTGGTVRDLKVIRPGYAADTTQVFTEDFLRSVRPFGVIRTMDFTHTNNNLVTDWAGRSHVTDATQTTNKGAAWEYAIDLANATGKDLWVNIPAGATDDYVEQLATLLKARLAPDRVVYVEYSNEVWNGIFNQHSINRSAAVAEVEAGMASGTPSNLYYPGEDALAADGSWLYQYIWAFRRYALRTTEIGQTFASVWGAAAVPEQVRPVLNAQLVNPGMLDTMLSFVEDRVGPARQYLYAVAGTTYFNTHGAGGANDLTTDQVLAALSDSVDHEKTTYLPFTSLAAAYGLKHFAGEGGVDTFGWDNIAAKKAASLDPRMTSLVTTFLDNWYLQGGDLLNWYIAGATSYDTRFGTWGLTNDPTNLDSPKYQAINEVVSSAPPEVTVGTPIPNAVPASATSAYLGNVATGAINDYLLRAPVGGTYALTLKYAAVTAGQVQVIVNGSVAGTINLGVTGPGRDTLGAPSTFANSSEFLLRLDSGLNNVRLVTATGGFSLGTLTFSDVGGVVSPPQSPPPPPPASPPPPPPSGGSWTIDHSGGFVSGTGLALNGSARMTGDALRLTTAGNSWVAGSAWASTPVAVNAFSTRFTFRLGGAAPGALGDGLTFVLQGQGPTAAGGGGVGVGSWGVGWSVAVAFNMGDDGTGAGVVGLHTAGARPLGPNDLDLASAGMSLRSGNPFAVALDYDGATLRMVLTDTVTGVSVERSWAINIPAWIGNRPAYVGFTGGTGDRTANADILNWTYSAG